MLTRGVTGSSAEASGIFSPPFACGALAADLLKALGNPKAGQGDCSLEATTIEVAYDPTTIFKIPVVVHIVHKTDGTGLIGEAVVQSQIAVLDGDFNAWGDAAAGAEAGIYFHLASEDENGTPSSGIVYHDDDRLFDCVYPCTAMKEQLSVDWDPNRYLNIFVAGGGAIGFRGWSTFAQNPLVVGTGADGVVVDWRVFGDSAPGVPYNRGHTATHQIGHYLGLLHTFAPEPSGCPSGIPSCFADDGDLLCDTSPAFEATFGCGVTEVVPCLTTKGPRGDVFGPANFMNFADDACIEGFTSDQVNRMRCTLVNYRPSLFVNEGPFIFLDGFESGDTSHWTDTVGKRAGRGDAKPVRDLGPQGED